MNNNIPLGVLMENARGKFVKAVNQVIEETKLPAYLLEGMVLDLLADIRNRKSIELLSDINSIGKEQTAASEQTEAKEG